jgi:hypothetical protein
MAIERAAAYQLRPDAYDPLPCGGRALRPGAEYVRAFEREPLPRKSKKATRTSADSQFSAAATSARDRAAGGVPLSHADHHNLGRPTSTGTLESIKRGGQRGAHTQRTAAANRILGALAADPSLRSYGQRVLVTGLLERPGNRKSPCFLVRCSCGAEGYVDAGQWVRRANVGRACTKCSVRRGARKEKAPDD